MLKLFVILVSVFAFSNVTLAKSDVKDANVKAETKVETEVKKDETSKEGEKEGDVKGGDMLLQKTSKSTLPQ